MYGVEFQTTVKNGVIEIPPEYRKSFRDRVRVILFSDEASKAMVKTNSLRPFALCAGEFSTPDDFDAPLPEHIVREFEGQ
jgi:hypothetical protein